MNIISSYETVACYNNTFNLRVQIQYVLFSKTIINILTNIFLIKF